MNTELILLPGWGFAPAVLQPLADALQAAGITCRIEALPALTSSDPAVWLDELDARLPAGAWLGGWSLGGMLAVALAARRQACPGVITLASNACFVASADWPQAMAAETFNAFRAGCAAAPAATARRFALLCSQGCSEARSLGRQLGAQPASSDAEVLVAGLDVLAALDNRAALQQLTGRQLHLLASEDALLPVAAAADLLQLLDDGEVDVLENSGHAFVLEQPAALAALLADFLREVSDD